MNQKRILEKSLKLITNIVINYWNAQFIYYTMQGVIL